MSPDDYCLPDALPAHIPESIRWELEAAVRVFLTSSLPLDFIWIFGSYARGDFINDHNINEDGIPTSYESDLDLMIILKENPKRLDRIKERLRQNFVEHEAIVTHIHSLYITGESLNRHLKKGQFFYCDVITEGFPLFDSGEFQLEEPQPPQIASDWKDNFDMFRDCFEKALGFQQGFVFYYHSRNHALSCFCLHQVVENLFHAFLMVFTGYRHRSHDLEYLGGQAASRLPQIKTVFPRKLPEEKARLEKLQLAYAEARYKRSFSIRRADLKELAGPVGVLEKMVFEACQTQAQIYAEEKTIPAYVPTVPFLDVPTMLDSPPPVEIEFALKEKALALALTEKENARERAKQAEQREANKTRQLEEQELAIHRKNKALKEKKEALKSKEAALKEAQEREEQERLAKEEALRENERLLALLKAKE